MAYVPLIPTSLSASPSKGQAQSFVSGIVKDLSNVAVDLSGWTSLTAVAVPIATNPCTADVSFGTVTGNADGTLQLDFAATDMSSLEPGTANLVIKGKPTGGDPFQQLARGTLTLQAG